MNSKIARSKTKDEIQGKDPTRPSKISRRGFLDVRRRSWSYWYNARPKNPCMIGLNQVLKMGWDIVHNDSSTAANRLQALALINDSYKYVMDLTTNGCSYWCYQICSRSNGTLEYYRKETTAGYKNRKKSKKNSNKKTIWNLRKLLTGIPDHRCKYWRLSIQFL